MHRAFTFTSYEWKHYIEERIDVNRVLGNKNSTVNHALFRHYSYTCNRDTEFVILRFI